MSVTERACDECLARAWLLEALAAHLERARGRIEAVLALENEELIDAVSGRRRQTFRDELACFDAPAARQRTAAAGVQAVCGCDPGYPGRLRMLECPPAVLHIKGDAEQVLELLAGDPVAIVGARRASSYGAEVAHALGRSLALTRLTVISGMALGVDCAAHSGALAAGGPTVAVLPAGAERPYPAAKRILYRRICESGGAISELPPGVDVWRWMFPARNRLIAALSAMTVVVEAGEYSGSLVTAGVAERLGRLVGAVPGRVTSPQAAGTNGLIARGARVVRGPHDVLEALFGEGARSPEVDRRAPLHPALQPLFEAIGDGVDTAAALSRAGLDSGDGLAALAALELAGYIRREQGGRFVVVP